VITIFQSISLNFRVAAYVSEGLADFSDVLRSATIGLALTRCVEKGDNIPFSALLGRG